MPSEAGSGLDTLSLVLVVANGIEPGGHTKLLEKQFEMKE